MAGAYNYSSLDFINQGSAQVGRNYIKNGGGEVNKIGWSTFADAASSTPADGTGGSPNSTWTTTTSSPLRGSGSFLWTKSSGASRQGEGVAYDFVVDSSDKGKALQIKFDYAIASGTFVDDDMTVWIYDVTNATMIQPAPYKLKNHSLASETFGLEFQTATTSTSYRLILYVPVTTNSANTVKFDNFSIGPANLTRGPPVTDWVSYTPTFTGTSNGLAWTNSTTTGYWRRVGDSAEIWIYTTFSAAPTTGTGNFQWGLPSGLSIDTTKDPTSGANYGYGSGRDSGTTGNREVYFVSRNGTTAVTLTGRTDAGVDTTWNATAPFTMGASDNVTLTFTVPISGWSSSVIMSSDADTRVVAFSGQKSAAQTGISGATTITYGTTNVDTHAIYASGTGKVTIPVPGKYRIYASLQFESIASGEWVNLLIYKNTSTQLADSLNYSTQTSHWISVQDVRDLVAGDTVEVKANNSGATFDAASGGRAIFIVEKLSGPAQIAASERISFVASTTGVKTMAPNASAVKVAFDAKSGTGLKDSHGGFDTTNNRYVVQSSGDYTFQSVVYVSATNVLANNYGLRFYKNGSLAAVGEFRWATVATALALTISTEIPDLIAGDYIEVYFYGAGNNSVATLSTDSGYNTMRFSGQRVGGN